MKEQIEAKPIQDAYFKGLSASPNDSFYVEGIKQLCALSEENRFNSFTTLVDNINMYKVNKNYASFRTKKAWETLEDFFLSKSEDLKKYELIPLVYGSIIFDDPKNLDYDLLLVSDTNKNMDKLVDTWNYELNEMWKNVGSCGHFSHLDLVPLQINAFFTNSNLIDYVENHAEMIDFTFMDTGALFTGETININNSSFLEINNKLPLFREKTLKIAKKSPILLSTVIRNLQQTLIIRETRRSGLNI